MEFEFVLPQRHEDLLDATGRAYCVTQHYKQSECNEKIRLARIALTELGIPYIFDFYDVFHSIVELAKEFQSTTIFRAMDLLYKSIDLLGKVLAEFLLKTDATQNERSIMLNALKMLLYANISLVKKVDKDVFVTEGKKSKKQANDSENERWEALRYAALLQLFNILQLPLRNLWDPPIAEEDFVNLCAEFAYCTIEHSSIKKKNVEDTAFQVLGTLLKNYNHSIVFRARIFELMKNSEMSAAAIAGGVVILHEAYGHHTILKVIIEQILDGLDTSSAVADGPVVKNISNFFTELGNAAPTLVMPFIREIASEILNLESYQLRICFLQLMSEIVNGELSGEELTQDQKDIRDEYLDHIFSHIHDVNAHVRSKALGLWCQLKKDDAVPLIWLSPVAARAVGRLEDKSNLVRKNSIHLIKSFLERNPFAAKLSIEELEKRYDDKLKELSDLRNKMNEEADKMEQVNDKWEEVLEEMKPYIEETLKLESIEDERIRPEDCENLYMQFPKMIEEKDFERLMLLVRRAEELNGNWETIKVMDLAHAQLYFAMLLKSYDLLQNTSKSNEEEYKKTENAVRFLEDSLKFSRIIVNAVPKLQELLMSKADSDVTEAIDFFTSAYQFGIKNTESGMRQLLYLVWSLSKDKRGPIRDAYKCVLFSTNHEGRAHAVKAVYNLMQFIENLTFSQFVAFEELVKEFVESEEIDNNMIQVMFEVYTKKLENVSGNDSRLALQLLVICSNAKPSIARANVEMMENLCFSVKEGLKDSRVFTLTLEFLMNVLADKQGQVYNRMEGDNERVLNVLSMYKKYFFHDETECFDDVCSKTFQYVYSMCHLPNVISQELIKEIWNKLVELSNVATNDVVDEQQVTDEVISQFTQPTFSQAGGELGVPKAIKVPVTLISRFIFMIGYVAMKELIYLDVDIFSNLKYRQELTDLVRNKKKSSKNSPRPSMNLSSAMAVKRRSEYPTLNEEEENEDDVVGQSNDDIFAEQINAISENEMLFHKDSIFRRFIPMIVDILKHPKKYNIPELQRSSLLALIHLMSVSSEFCQKNMPFLMNIFSHAQDIDIKCNVIIGMSDLTFRFPNVIEPWSAQLYSTLHDENREIRLTSVRILSHLISHEMILVKGQISDLALCIVDKDEEIKKTTEIFFKEIANKSNILYNVLPDIISRLSDTKLKLEEGKYQIIMRYIIGLINKDRQIEGLVEKLCYRFKVTEQERQWRDISFCLSLLTYTEKTIKKLIEHIILFKDKVQVQEVYDFFKAIISNTSKLAKPDLKALVQDFEAKLEDCLAVRDGENGNREDADEDEVPRRMKAPIVRSRPARNKPSGKKQPSRRNRRRSSSSSDSALENQPPSRKKGVRKAVSSDSEEEISPTKKSPARVGRATKVIQETSSDESPSHSSKPQAKRGKKR